MKEKTRILLVDDHPIVCEGLAQLINQESDLEVVGKAQDAPEAMRQISALQPDFLIIDISLEGKSGIELMSEIRTQHPDVPILALSMHAEPIYVERALRVGARGYVNKNEATNVIIKAIRRCLGGGVYLSETMSGVLLDSLYGKERESGKTPVERLSDREFEVFRLIGQGLRSHKIAEILGVSAKTVDAHREHIREKLNLKDSYELFGYALQWTRTFDNV